MTNQYIEILFLDNLSPGDLEIIIPATAAKPGRAKLKRARLGKRSPETPNSQPLLSASAAGGKIGFVAEAALIEPPYTDTYWLIEEAVR